MKSMTINKQAELERIYQVISENPGQFCAADLHERFHDSELVYRSVASLRHAGRIKAKKGFGRNGVVWMYYPQ